MHSIKKILKTAGLFLLLVALLSTGLAALYFHGECFFYQDAREREALSGSVSLLGCGSSNMYFGFRPDVMDAALGGKSYNLSGLLVSMGGRLELLKLELARNPVRTVLLEVSAETLVRDRAEEGTEGDLQILGRLDGKERLNFFLHNFSLSEYPAVYYDVVSKGIDNALRLVNGSFQTRNGFLHNGYYPNAQKNVYISTWVLENYHTASLSTAIRPENVEALKQIAALCREQGAELILINTPKSEFYDARYDNLDYFRAWYTGFAAAQHIDYYDCNLYREKHKLLDDQEHFGDETHLSDSGAELFTGFLADILAARARGENLEPLFYADYEARDWAVGYLY